MRSSRHPRVSPSKRPSRVTHEPLENRLLLSAVLPALTGAPFIPVPAHIESENWAGGGPSLSVATIYSSPYGNPTNNFAIVNTQPGQWIEYNITASKSAIYRVRANVSDFWSGGQFHIEIDGTNVSGEVTVHSTQFIFSDCDSNAFWLSAGDHRLRFVMDKAGPGGIVGTFDSFWVDEGGYGPFNQNPLNIATDTTPQNVNAQYRPFQSVDINAGGSNGYSVGYVMKGERLNYTIASPTNSTYQLQARVACYRPGGTFHVEIDGKNATGPMVVPDTGPWDTWTTITSPAFAVTNTTHHMTVVMDKGGFWQDVVGDIDYFKFVKTAQPAPPVLLNPVPYHGAPADILTQFPIQAEDFDAVTSPNSPGLFFGGEGIAYHDTDPQNLGGQYRFSDSVDLIPGAYPYGNGGDVYAVGYTAPGEWLRYTISAPVAGSYLFQSRIANKGPGGTFHMEIDGKNVTGTLAVPDTGGYFNWTTLSSKSFNLSAGTHVMHVVMDSPGPLGNIGNFDYFQFASATPTHAINADASDPFITLVRDADGIHVDWATKTCHGAFPIADPQGLTLNTGGALRLDYSAGNPLPNVLRLNADFSITGMKGANPFSNTTIDLANHTAWFSYDSAPSLPTALRNALKAGYNNGAWNGVSPAGAINSSSAATAPAGRYSLGYMCDYDSPNTLAPDTLEVRYTLAGDANLDATVNSADALILARHYLTPNCFWSQADFNYDSATDPLDAAILQKNWGNRI